MRKFLIAWIIIASIHLFLFSTPSRAADIGRYTIFEQAFTPPSPRPYNNPWEDATLTVTLASPSGRTIRVGGFYERPGRWLVRFAPDEIGRWTWAANFTDIRGASSNSSGSFNCVNSSEPGFIRRHPANPYRLVHSLDGSAYLPIGIGDCFWDARGNGNPLDNMGLDGGFRLSQCPPSDSFCAKYGWTTTLQNYLMQYGRSGAGFNLFRVSNANCSDIKIFTEINPRGNKYDETSGRVLDDLSRQLRASGFRIFFEIFGFSIPFKKKTELTDSAKEALRRYARYVVDRWGAYVDFWELMNEARPDADNDEWYPVVADAIRNRDPYHHLISTSWERADLPVIDINAPHWYELENELESDAVMSSQIAEKKRRAANKLIVYGEQGNSGWNWSDRSATRMRLRAWTALFREATLIFWNSSFAKDMNYNKSAGNIFLGPEERQFVRQLQNFAARVPADVAIIEPRNVSKPLRAYALGGANTTFLYVVNSQDHTNQTRNMMLSLDFPTPGTATWISPATGAVISSVTISAGENRLSVPNFTIDIALYKTP